MIWLSFTGPGRRRWNVHFGNAAEYPELRNEGQASASELYAGDSEFAAITGVAVCTIWINSDRKICEDPEEALLHELMHVSARARERDFSDAAEEKVIRAASPPLFRMLRRWGLAFPRHPRAKA